MLTDNLTKKKCEHGQQLTAPTAPAPLPARSTAGPAAGTPPGATARPLAPAAAPTPALCACSPLACPCSEPAVLWCTLGAAEPARLVAALFPPPGVPAPGPGHSARFERRPTEAVQGPPACTPPPGGCRHSASLFCNRVVSSHCLCWCAHPSPPAALQRRVASRVACCCRFRRRRLMAKARTAGGHREASGALKPRGAAWCYGAVQPCWRRQLLVCGSCTAQRSMRPTPGAHPLPGPAPQPPPPRRPQ